MITFKTREYLMQIYNTDTGDRILSAVGYIQDENTAVFNIYWGNMYYENTMGDLVLEKSILTNEE